MTAYDVTIATCRPLPEPDPDESPLVDALQRAGLVVRVCPWHDERIDWSASALTLLRSTWDYYRDRPGFLRWAAHVDDVSTLLNPPSIVRWNSHKAYLLELAERGVSVVPTRLVERGADVDLHAIGARRGWARVVVKPAVSASSFETHVIDLRTDDTSAFARLVTTTDVLVQPYIDSVDTAGERSVILIEDRITHSIKKGPRFAGDDEQVSGPHPVSAAQRRLVRSALAPIDVPLLYARVDMVQDAAGAPMLAELELIEPSLFFRFRQRALSRMVDGVIARLRWLESAPT